MDKIFFGYAANYQMMLLFVGALDTVFIRLFIVPFISCNQAENKMSLVVYFCDDNSHRKYYTCYADFASGSGSCSVSGDLLFRFLMA